MLLMILYTVFLFVLLTPAILVRLPPKGNKWTVAIVHGLIFSVILHLTQRTVLGLTMGIEGMENTDVSQNSVKATNRGGSVATKANDKYAANTASTTTDPK